MGEEREGVSEEGEDSGVRCSDRDNFEDHSGDGIGQRGAVAGDKPEDHEELLQVGAG